MKRPTPASRHRRHRYPEQAIEDCWMCGRERAVCRSKPVYATVEEADADVARVHRESGYARKVSRYPCAWCPGWHKTTARTKVQLKRIVKAYRKERVAAAAAAV